MVVDQHEDVCERLAQSLDRIPGIKVLAQTMNLMSAGELAHQSAPDVIVADFKWGGTPRSEILRWLGRMSPQSTLVVYSSYYRDGEREAFAGAGASACLLKGISAKELAAQLRKAVAKRTKTAHFAA
jgi:DNA-binding NarL/FixJ family response regulator